MEMSEKAGTLWKMHGELDSNTTNQPCIYIFQVFRFGSIYKQLEV